MSDRGGGRNRTRGLVRLTAVIAVVLLVRLVGVPAFGQDLRASAARTAREAGLQGDAQTAAPGQTRMRPGLVWTAAGLAFGGIGVLLASGLECGSERQCRDIRRGGAALLGSSLALAVIAAYAREPIVPGESDESKAPGCRCECECDRAAEQGRATAPRVADMTAFAVTNVDSGSGLVFRPGGFALRKTIRF